MEVLFAFLKWVASFAHLDEETGSKMDLPNLASVISPSILYSRTRDGIRDESFGAIRVVTSLLENQDEFFCVPEDFLPILHDQDYFASSMDLPSKEFLRKCDTYTRVKASGRTPGLTSPVLGASPFTSAAGAAPPRSDDPRAMPPRCERSSSLVRAFSNIKVVSELLKAIRSTSRDRPSARHRHLSTRCAMGCNHAHSRRQVCSMLNTPILPLAARLRPCHRAWRLSRRHNLEPPTGTLRTGTVNGHPRRCRSHQAARPRAHSRSSNLGIAAMGSTHSTRIRTRHRPCGRNAFDFAPV